MSLSNLWQFLSFPMSSKNLTFFKSNCQCFYRISLNMCLSDVDSWLIWHYIFCFRIPQNQYTLSGYHVMGYVDMSYYYNLDQLLEVVSLGFSTIILLFSPFVINKYIGKDILRLTNILILLTLLPTNLRIPLVGLVCNNNYGVL